MIEMMKKNGTHVPSVRYSSRKQTAAAASVYFGDGILRALVREALESDLTLPQRQVIEAVWFRGMRVTGYARSAGISPQVASRHLRAAMRNLQDALHFAVRYAQESKKLAD
ncbi:MAG: hypothetical protein LBN05_02995 [Oscillospiraceae bacterium]|nr:hypothetical protein [Oscillospiraceae bacterium]